jgi:mono/diheme cytochrome c family protein
MEPVCLTAGRVLGIAAVLAVIGIPSAWRQGSGAERSTADGVYTDDQANRGQAISGRKCLDCHGETLDGGTLAPSLRGAEFLSSWQGKPLRRIYSRIISTMPPGDVGSLTENETLDLVALVLRVNGYPAGPQALARADELNSIVVAPPEGKR